MFPLHCLNRDINTLWNRRQVLANVLSPLPEEETPEEKATRLVAQNAMGTRFFGMDDNGYPVSDRLEDVLGSKACHGRR